MVTLEQVDQMRKRTNCSYEEAKFFLEKHNGDVLEAIVDFEKSKNGTKTGSYNTRDFDSKRQINDFWQSVSKLIRKGFETRVVIEGSNNVFIDIPVNILLLFVIFASYIVIPALLILLLLGYKLSIRKSHGEVVDISSMVQDVTSRNTNRNQNKNQNQNVQHQPQDIAVNTEEQKNDYNEIIIE
ncbi:MAG: DUF4342 domain-containing protein [Clostridiaceae bacterium]|nr:DUF4342 domain-containing protein [Clostridiaceae bacterium]